MQNNQKIAQIYRDEIMAQVEIVFQKVENARSRYEKSKFFYRVLLPGPLLLVWQLKKLLNYNQVTRQLTETFNPDYMALLLYSVFYGVWAFSGLAMTLTFWVSFSIKSWNFPWWTTALIFFCSWGIRVFWYQNIISKTFDRVALALNNINSYMTKFDESEMGG